MCLEIRECTESIFSNHLWNTDDLLSSELELKAKYIKAIQDLSHLAQLLDCLIRLFGRNWVMEQTLIVLCETKEARL